MNKWVKRREQQVRKCEMNVPTCASTLLGDIFRSFGVPVYYSEVDNDDTMAAYANAYGATILSQDKDYFRYYEGNFTIWCDYEITKNGYLKLTQSQYFHHPKPRKLLNPLPQVHKYQPIVQRTLFNRYYLKGNPSALTKFVGNFHGIIKPLRKAFYSSLGATEPIEESYPEWDDKREEVYWV